MTEQYEPTEHHPLARQAAAMALAQGWSLAVHVCAMRAGHPHAEAIMADDIAGLEHSGGMPLVVGAMGADLAEKIGAGSAMEIVKARLGRGEPPVRALAEALADVVESDGAAAQLIVVDAQARADFEAILASALDQLENDDGD